MAAPEARRGTIRIVCTSDTHNDVPKPEEIPFGDVFIHAGDMTDDGTLEELQVAFDWISNLPHKIKLLVAGNHDLSLDPFHPATTRGSYLKARHLFKSPLAVSRGVHYLDSEVRSINPKRADTSSSTPASDDGSFLVYGNPHQPEFLGMDYAFIYKPHPSDSSAECWASAPRKDDDVPIWIMHGGPKGRLDKIHLPGLEGCPVELEKILQARPKLVVFGHYHMSYGVERVRFDDNDEILEVQTLGNPEAKYDFSDLEKGKETVFVNVAWMTGKKREVPERNKPVVLDMVF